MSLIMVHRRKSPPPKDIAFERINHLLRIASEKKNTEPILSEKYVRLAERIAKRLDISLPANIKRSYCKKCGLPYGNLTRFRIKRGVCIVTCSNCNDIRRIPYKN